MLSLACFAWVLTFESAATAQDEERLSYDAPGEVCPTSDAVRARLDELLRAAPAGELPPIVSSIQISAEGDGYVATIVMREEAYEDRRALADVDCAVLADAAVFVVAVALYPGVTREGTAPLVAPDPTVASTAVADATAEPPRPGSEPVTPEPTGERVMLGSVWLAVHASYGVLPGVAVGGELGGSIAFEHLRIDLAARGLPFVGARFGGSPLLGGDIAQVVGLVRARGVAAPVPNLELAAGGGIEAGAALGTGVGISDPRSASAPWVAIEGVLGIAWVPSSFVALFLEIEALVPIVRPVFTVAGIGVLYRPEPVGGALRLALELRIP